MFRSAHGRYLTRLVAVPLFFCFFGVACASRVTSAGSPRQAGAASFAPGSIVPDGLWHRFDEAQTSPDAKIVARVRIDTRFGTPAGENSCLFLGSRAVYPPKCDHAKDTYTHIHTLLSTLAWSPDSSKVAFVEKIFDWEYYDPFGAYFDGAVSDLHYWLVIAGSDSSVAGYRLRHFDGAANPHWSSNTVITLGGEPFDLHANPPARVP